MAGLGDLSRRLWLLTLVLVACSPIRVTVVGSGSKVRGAPKPAGCALQIFVAPPAAPFDELGTLHLESSKNAPEQALEALHNKACALSADAVVVTQPFTRTGDSAVMTATALRYRRGTKTDPLHPVPSSL